MTSFGNISERHFWKKNPDYFYDYIVFIFCKNFGNTLKCQFWKKNPTTFKWFQSFETQFDFDFGWPTGQFLVTMTNLMPSDDWSSQYDECFLSRDKNIEELSIKINKNGRRK